MATISLLSCQTGPKTAEIELDAPIPEPPQYPVIEFHYEEETGRVWTTLEEARRLAKYRVEVEAYIDKVETALKGAEIR